jgi:hypothetical protein
MARTIIVSVSPNVLLNGSILSALLWSGQISEDEDRDELIARRTRIGHFQIKVDQYDGDHQFGPTLTLVHKSRSPLKLTLPWHQILAVVSDESGKMPIGFGADKPETKVSKQQF